MFCFHFKCSVLDLMCMRSRTATATSRLFTFFFVVFFSSSSSSSYARSYPSSKAGVKSHKQNSTTGFKIQTKFFLKKPEHTLLIYQQRCS